MSFCSLDFIFIFLPIFVIIHAVINKKLKNITLFIGSTLYYLLASSKYYEWIVLLLLTTAMNYIFGIAIGSFTDKKRNIFFKLGIVFNVVFLLMYKYADLYLSAILPVFKPIIGDNVFVSNIALPLGISFYTFKNLSYLREVYSKNISCEKSFINYAAYLTLFPQISMGPIQTYKSFSSYLHSRTVDIYAINSGLSEFIIGFGLKKIFADRLSAIWNGVETTGIDSISTTFAWLGIISFSLQLYFDFYGYSLMASGIGQMLGYRTPDNFNYPYISSSVSDFWRRWHITLGDWFKENVYFPLGGNRCSKTKHIFNLFAVWILTAIWHGSTLNFIVWGLFLFILIMLEKYRIVNFIISNKIFSHIYMTFVILFSWTLFKLPSVSDVGIYLSRMFPFFTETPNEVYSVDWFKYFSGAWPFIIFGIIFSTPLPRKLYEKYIKNNQLLNVPIMLVIFWYSVYLTVYGANDPFLYFAF